MVSHPKTVLEFNDRFRDEADCRAYLEAVRWPAGPRCPKCPKARVWTMRPPYYRCTGCGRDFTVTAGTLFADTHLPLRVWFQAMWHVVNQKNGASALGVQRVLGLGSYRTAWNWMHKLRRAMVRAGRDRLGTTVEVDEIYLGGGAPGTFGRGAAGKTLVLVAAQVEGGRIGRIRLVRVADASAGSLRGAIQSAVQPGSQVLTDGWQGYASLGEHGYRHEVVRAGALVGDNLLPRANRVASLLQRWLMGTHQGAVHATHLDYYLDEFTFRFNRRNSGSRGLLFHRLVEQALALAPIPSDELVGGSHHK
jgi:transposase-like protein